MAQKSPLDGVNRCKKVLNFGRKCRGNGLETRRNPPLSDPSILESYARVDSRFPVGRRLPGNGWSTTGRWPSEAKVA